MFRLPRDVRRIIWRNALKMRNAHMKVELVSRQELHRRALDVTAENRFLCEEYLHRQGQGLADHFFRVAAFTAKPLSADLTLWLAGCKYALSSFAAKELEQTRRLLAVLIWQYALVISPSRMSCEQIQKALDLYDCLQVAQERQTGARQ